MTADDGKPRAQGWQNLEVKDKWKEVAAASECVIASHERGDNCLRSVQMKMHVQVEL